MIFFVFHDIKLGGGTDGAHPAKSLIFVVGLTLTGRACRARQSRPACDADLVQLVATYAVLAWLLRSLFRRVMEGIRVNEHRMEAMGVNATRDKLTAFTGG